LEDGKEEGWRDEEKECLRKGGKAFREDCWRSGGGLSERGGEGLLEEGKGLKSVGEDCWRERRRTALGR
jgi:hypothetical protein